MVIVVCIRVIALVLMGLAHSPPSTADEAVAPKSATGVHRPESRTSAPTARVSTEAADEFAPDREARDNKHGEPATGATPAQDQEGITPPEYEDPHRWGLTAEGSQRKDWLTGADR